MINNSADYSASRKSSTTPSPDPPRVTDRFVQQSAQALETLSILPSLSGFQGTHPDTHHSQGGGALGQPRTPLVPHPTLHLTPRTPTTVKMVPLQRVHRAATDDNAANRKINS